MIRKLAFGLMAVGLIAITALGLVWLNMQSLLLWQVERNVVQNLDLQDVPPSRFEIIFCGTGSPQFQPDRGQPCTGIVAGGKLYVFDTGQGAAQGLSAAQAPLLNLQRVFLTHLHSDHISGLGDVLHNSWLYGRQNKVVVAGPPGTERLLKGVKQTFKADIEERQYTIGSEYDDSSVGMGSAQDIIIDGDALVEVHNENGLVVSAFRVDHPNWPHAYGYKVQYAGKSIIISGDTRYSPNLAFHAENADYLIHEVLNVTMMQTIGSTLRKHGGGIDPARMEKIIGTHTSTKDLAKLAQETNTKHLVLTHLIPPIPANTLVEQAFVDGMSDIYRGKMTVARDGFRIRIEE